VELAYWINERHAIKLRRAEGIAKPWSADPIFQGVRFCNVHREDDKVTQWIRRYWNRKHDPVWKFVLARMINLPESLEGCLRSATPESMNDLLHLRRDSGAKVFTSAYTISTCGKSMDKLDYVFDWVLRRVRSLPAIDYTSCDTTWQSLTKVDGLGSFLAAQVVADMKNTEGHFLESAQDFWTFSKPGPGSLRGLSWYFYGEPEHVTATGYATHLRGCREEVDPLVPELIPRISDQDFQNCLCEFSKYMKVKKDNRAHVRNRFKGY
jgi:hypothetical protein